mmetsp:Transcript_2394/g.3357  ORF Transcript_2394/g.3357 Transcript_2394/m.3357 type:complete len:218 (+) Transcript_2394:127-780(+)
MTKQYEPIPQVKNMEVDEGTALTTTPQDDTNMASLANFNVSLKKLTTFCAVLMGCTILLLNRQNFGTSIRGGVASSLPSLGEGEDYSCNIIWMTVGSKSMSDSGSEAEVKVHIMVNGQWKYQDQKVYHFAKYGGVAALSDTYGYKTINNSDKIKVFFEEVDDFSGNDWAATGELTNLCRQVQCFPGDQFCWWKKDFTWTAYWPNGGSVRVNGSVTRR